MNETYVECMVAHKKSPLAGSVKYIAYVLAAVFFIGGLLFNALLLLLGIACVIAGMALAPMMDIEYEYLYLDRSLSIDKVLAKEKRKHVVDIDLNKMEIMAPSTSHELDSYRSMQLPYVEYASGMEGAQVYVIVYSDQDSRRMIGIEPNQELLDAIKMLYPRKVVDKFR